MVMVICNQAAIIQKDWASRTPRNASWTMIRRTRTKCLKGKVANS